MRPFVYVEMMITMVLGALTFSSTVNAQEILIHIKLIAFSPQRIEAHVGDRIIWVNDDGVRHGIYFTRNPTNSEDQHLKYQIKPDQSISIIATKPGDFDYKCPWHGMIGSLHIE